MADEKNSQEEREEAGGRESRSREESRGRRRSAGRKSRPRKKTAAKKAAPKKAGREEAGAKKPAEESRASRKSRRAESRAKPAPIVVRASARYVRVAPRKARLVADQVRGLQIEEARALLAVLAARRRPATSAS